MAPGSGGILSNANDMAIYTDFHINYGKVGDKQIVPGVRKIPTLNGPLIAHWDGNWKF